MDGEDVPLHADVAVVVSFLLLKMEPLSFHPSLSLSAKLFGVRI